MEQEPAIYSGIPPRNSFAPLSMPEDSILREILTCVPLIGNIPALTSESSLTKKLKDAKWSDISSQMRIYQVKNRYHTASLVRHVLTLALSVFILSLGILSGIGMIILGSVTTILFVIGTSFVCYKIHKNRQAIIEIKRQISISV